MTTEAVIRQKITAALTPVHLEIEDFSDCGCGLKFNVIVVSEQFEGKPLLARHRLVNGALAQEMSTIHALTMKTWTPKQWEDQKQKIATN